MMCAKERLTMLHSKRALQGRQERGFTLIELMIVVVVIAVLAAIAYPSYQDYVRKARRGQAKADLVEYAQLAERSRTVNNTYAEFALPTDQSPREANSPVMYKISFVDDPTATTFEIQAEPEGIQANDKCGTLSINQAGVKTPADQGCW